MQYPHFTQTRGLIFPLLRRPFVHEWPLSTFSVLPGLHIIGVIDTNVDICHIGSVNTNIALKTAQAAEVAGVGYEGFRSWLKRGLLKEAGLLPKFYAPNVPAEIADTKRWRWSSFSFVDLCSFRLAKVLFDAGLPWETVDPIVHQLWRSHGNDGPAERYLAVFAKTSQWTLYSAQTLADDLAAGIVRSEWMTLVNLQELRKSVMIRTRVAALRAIADDVAKTAHISAKSGAALFTPEQAAQRLDRLERLVGEFRDLAAKAEQGNGSYEEFEMLLTRLHKDGKVADASAVSTLAAAFPDPAVGRL
jgi:hypothetical protein